MGGRMMPHSAASLRPWLNDPVVQDAVVAVMTRGDYPMLLSEVAVACDLPIRAANRVLLRLHRKGVVSRYKLPIQRHAYCRKRRTCVPGAATRMLYVYTWAGVRA